MKLVSFSTADGKVRPGALMEDAGVVADLGAADFADTLSVITSGLVARVTQGTYPEHPLSKVRLHAPLANPPRVFAIGLNYHDHAIESKMPLPPVPVVFFKMTTAIIGPGENIVLPRNSTKPDYEAEFAFVVGKGGYRIPAASWRDHVYGYTIVNDVSARDYQMATSQWLMGKTFDTFAPMGPALVTADEIAVPHDLDISLRINGEVLQSSNTRELIFKIPELIEFLSSVFTLEPGDVVSTGTPSGVGFARKPPRYLKAGDDVVVSVQGLGELRNPVIAAN